MPDGPEKRAPGLDSGSEAEEKRWDWRDQIAGDRGQHGGGHPRTLLPPSPRRQGEAAPPPPPLRATLEPGGPPCFPGAEGRR
eukprot:6936184-Pyramimonas_sp.AAC.1